MKIGKLAKKYCNLELELMIYKSNAGWYIGTMYNGEPISRESESYYATKKECQTALDNNTWTQKERP